MLFSLYKRIKLNGEIIRIHVLCWIIFALYEVVIAGFVNQNFLPFIQYFLFYVLNISLFYFHALYVLPVSLNDSKNWWRLPVLMVFVLAAYSIAGIFNLWVINHFFYNISAQDSLNISFTIVASLIYRAIYFILLATGYYFINKYLRSKEAEAALKVRMHELEKSKIQAELDFLRAQVNPHLLFNTLSFVQYAAKLAPDDADEAIVGLAELMDFALKKDNRSMIRLKEEVKQGEIIIRLHELRYQQQFHVQYIKNIVDEDMLVPPLCLVTLLENLFKHGNVNDPEFPARIIVDGTRDRIRYETHNLPRMFPFMKQEHSSTGLSNLRIRLELSYPGRHHFEYGQEGGVFKTKLEIWNEGENK